MAALVRLQQVVAAAAAQDRQAAAAGDRLHHVAAAAAYSLLGSSWLLVDMINSILSIKRVFQFSVNLLIARSKLHR